MQISLIELAEEPGLWIPLDPSSDTIVGDGYTFVTWGRRGTVERIRLGDVGAALADVRGLASERGLEAVTWWVGEHTTPGDVAEQLLELGLHADEETPELTSLTIDRRPAGESNVEVRRVETFDDYLTAIELDWEVWNVPAVVRDERRAQAREHWDMLVRDGRAVHYLAFIDGRPAGFGRAVFTPHATLLMGGATLPEARGRGVYTALIHARWEDTVSRGLSRIVVSAGAMSTPILARLGFERIGHVRLFTDRR